MGNKIEGEPSYQGYLNNRCVTIAEVLRAAGYRTGISGKWHCGGDPDRADEGHPQLQRGFDQMFWFEGGNGLFPIIPGSSSIRTQWRHRAQII